MRTPKRSFGYGVKRGGWGSILRTSGFVEAPPPQPSPASGRGGTYFRWPSRLLVLSQIPRMIEAVGLQIGPGIFDGGQGGFGHDLGGDVFDR